MVILRLQLNGFSLTTTVIYLGCFTSLVNRTKGFTDALPKIASEGMNLHVMSTLLFFVSQIRTGSLNAYSFFSGEPVPKSEGVIIGKASRRVKKFSDGFRPGCRFANLAYIASYTAQQSGNPVTFRKTLKNRCLHQMA